MEELATIVEISPTLKWQDRNDPDLVGSQPLGIRLCTEKDFEDVNATHVWNEKNGQAPDSLICIDNLKNVVLNKTSTNPVTTRGI